MKLIKYLFILTLVLTSCQVPKTDNDQQSITDEEIQIAKDLIQGSFDDLWAGVDSTKISTYHTDNFIILEQGEVWDNNRIKAYMRKQLARPDRPKRTNRMEYISIDKYGTSIQIAYHNFAEFTRADTLVGKAQWLESALAVYTEDGWRLKMMHSTRAKADN
ncbi:nuclear transport factor 2 family protein [Ascidiimonas aurantiaca]|uniref:nuclear transport factor 2 family protein n=1 Tax=Ascidiimonas aurantiaca TaxID=1685432 RepID=UPI0030EDC645